jgi:hypothetical protein
MASSSGYNRNSEHTKQPADFVHMPVDMDVRKRALAAPLPDDDMDEQAASPATDDLPPTGWEPSIMPKVIEEGDDKEPAPGDLPRPDEDMKQAAVQEGVNVKEYVKQKVRPRSGEDDCEQPPEKRLAPSHQPENEDTPNAMFCSSCEEGLPNPDDWDRYLYMGPGVMEPQTISKSWAKIGSGTHLKWQNAYRGTHGYYIPLCYSCMTYAESRIKKQSALGWSVRLMNRGGSRTDEDFIAAAQLGHTIYSQRMWLQRKYHEVAKAYPEE